MSTIMVDVLILPLLGLFFIGAKRSKSLDLLSGTEYLAVDNVKSYRGFFAISILLHHLALHTQTGMVFRYLILCGYLAVAFFFFLSGYGLQKSYILKAESYRRGFLLKRIPSVLIPYIAITVVYWLMNSVGRGQVYSLKEVILATIHGNPMVSFSWYIITILLFYIVFWLLMMVCRKHYSLMIFGSLIFYFVYVFLCFKMGYGRWWYNTGLLLIVGMIWAIYEAKILKFLNKFYFITVILFFTAFIILFVLHGMMTDVSINNLFVVTNGALINVENIWVITAVESFGAMFFVLSVIVFALKIKIGNRALCFLGEISLEIYLLQGLFIITLRSKFIYVNNDLLYCIAVIIGTIVSSYISHIVFRYILKKYRQLLCKANI